MAGGGGGICSTRLLPEKPTYHFTPPGNEGMFSGKEPFSKDMSFSKHQLLRGGFCFYIQAVILQQFVFFHDSIVKCQCTFFRCRGHEILLEEMGRFIRWLPCLLPEIVGPPENGIASTHRVYFYTHIYHKRQLNVGKYTRNTWILWESTSCCFNCVLSCNSTQMLTHSHI